MKANGLTMAASADALQNAFPEMEEMAIATAVEEVYKEGRKRPFEQAAGDRVQLTRDAVDQWNRDAAAEDPGEPFDELQYGADQGTVEGPFGDEMIDVNWDPPGLGGHELETVHNPEDLEPV
jgi:hypothetical protein